MVKIEYPTYKPKIKSEGDKEIIFDEVRKKWIQLTPEEWVRQNFLQYLLQVKKYPASLIAVERKIELGELQKRFDIVVYNNNHTPSIIIECKEQDVELNEKTIDQVLRYNIKLQVNYVVITNGNYCYAFKCVNGELKEINELPLITEL